MAVGVAREQPLVRNHAIGRSAGLSSGPAASLSIGTSLVLGIRPDDGPTARCVRTGGSVVQRAANITAALPQGFNLTRTPSDPAPSYVDVSAPRDRPGIAGDSAAADRAGTGCDGSVRERSRPEQMSRASKTTKAVGTGGVVTRTC
jgi:hypothetical protein